MSTCWCTDLLEEVACDSVILFNSPVAFICYFILMFFSSATGVNLAWCCCSIRLVIVLTKVEYILADLQLASMHGLDEQGLYTLIICVEIQNQKFHWGGFLCLKCLG